MVPLHDISSFVSNFDFNNIEGKDMCQFPEFATFHFIACCENVRPGAENITPDKKRLFLRLEGVSLKEF
jgi:hypothetical protein